MAVKSVKSANRLPARLCAVAFTLLMVTPLFAAPGSSLIHFTQPEQDAQIVNRFGAGAPFGTWEKQNEPTTFYFHGLPGCADGGGVGGTVVVPATVTTCAGPAPVPGGLPTQPPFQPDWWLDTRSPRPPVPPSSATPPAVGDQPLKNAQYVTLQSVDNTAGGGAIVPGQTLDFENQNCYFNKMQVSDETTITSFDAAIDMQGARSLDDRLRVWVWHLNADCTPKNPANPYIAIFDLRNSEIYAQNGIVNRDNFYRYSGSWTFPFVDPTQPYGVVMQKGERLRVSIGLISDSLNQGDSGAVVAFDGSGCFNEGTPAVTCPPALWWNDLASTVLDPCGGPCFCPCVPTQGVESFFRVHSDSIRVNQWTSDRFGDVTKNYPHTTTDQPADVADRTIHWSATAFNTWGHDDLECRITTPTCDPGYQAASGVVETDPDPYLHCNIITERTTVRDTREYPSKNCRHDALDEQKLRLRVKDVTPGHQGFDRYVPLDSRLGLTVWDSSSTYDTSFLGCCDAAFLSPIRNKAPQAWPGVTTGEFNNVDYQGRTNIQDLRLGLAHFDYDIVYSTDFLDGVYQIEFQESSKLWRFNTQFVVGSTGFQFVFADDEGPRSLDNTTAFHTVSLGQTTQYAFTVKNTGSVSDTYGLAIPVPGSGWTATVVPNTASLAPGASLEAIVTVVPPSTVHAGDKKVVAVAATSIVTNTVKTLYTITTYTTDTIKSAPYLTSPTTELNTRPKLENAFPLVLHNPGVVQDNYVVTGRLDEGSGSCPTAGFVVTINPTFLPVYAASRQALSVKVTAPGEASPGCTYTVHFQACSTLGQTEEGGALCSPLLDLPVRIFLIDALRLSPLTNLITMRDAELDQYTIDCPADVGNNAVGAGGGPGVTQPIVVADPTDTTSTLVSEDVEGSGACTYKVTSQDVYFDEGSVFRILVENNGDRTDRIELTGGWARESEQNSAWMDNAGCDGGNDGVPDGWRYRLLPGAPIGAAPHATPGGFPVDPGMTYPQPSQDPQNLGPPAPSRFTPNPAVPAPGTNPPWAPNEGTYDGSSGRSGIQDVTGPQYGAGADPTFAGEVRFGWLTLPAHTSQWVYVEMFWEPPNPSLIMPNEPPCNEEWVTVPGYGGCAGTTIVEAPPCQFIIYGDERPTIWRASKPSPWATLRLSWRSNNDDSLRGSMKLTTHLTGTGETIEANGNTPGSMLHDVRVELATGQPQDGFANINNTRAPFATYNIVATNIGNEYDDLIISVDNGKNGWKHSIKAVNRNLPDNQLQSTGIVPTGWDAVDGATFETPTPNPMTGEGSNRQDRGCDPPDTATSQRMVCHNIGVYDTVYFQVKATPPVGAAVGSYDDMAITVASGRSPLQVNTPGTMSDFVTVRSFVQGVFGFSLLHNNDFLTGWRGQTIAFPFTIKNVGTTNDVYRLFVNPADFEYYRDWNPQLSATSGFVDLNDATPTPALVGVPAGYEFHGFVSMTVPADEEKWPLSDPDFVDPDLQIRSLRLDILSTQGFGQSGVIDFFPVITPTPDFTMTVEETQIAGGTDLENHAGRMRITALGEFNKVLYNGYYKSQPNNAGAGGEPALPAGFRFVCLPPTHAQFDIERKCYDPYLPFNDPACTGCTLPFMVQPQGTSGGSAIQQLEVHVPVKQLGTSRVAHRIQGVANDCEVLPGNTEGCSVSYADGIIDMASVYGVDLKAACAPSDQIMLTAEQLAFSKDATCIIPPGTPGTSGSGPTLRFLVDVGNTGLTPQSVLLTHSTLPAGWQIFFNGTSTRVQPPGHILADSTTECALLGREACLPLNPQSHYWQEVGLIAPASAKEGDTAIIIIFGTVQEDPTIITQTVLKAVVGKYARPLLNVEPTTLWVTPQETARFPIVVKNEGNLPDVIQVQALVPSAVGGNFPTSWPEGTGCDDPTHPLMPPLPIPDPNDPPSCYVILPAEDGDDETPVPARALRLDVQTPEQLAPTGAGPGYTVTIAAHSVFQPTKAASIDAKVKILNYVSMDVDGDLLLEYAIDGCTTETQLTGCNPDASDGFETFRENLQSAGVITKDLRGVPELVQFLTPAAAADWEEKGGYYVDLDGSDGRVDHLLDTDGDGMPDVAWIPTAGVVQRLDFVKDVTLDQLPDYFINTDGDARGTFDTVFDLSTGRAYTLLHKFVDGDGYEDYIVDLNGNGEVDPEDTILIGGPGGIITRVQKSVDMDGDGLLDQVIDVNADGLPDFFLHKEQDGSYSDSFTITLQDVTGDGKLDWTYDHTGQNGKPDQYYDPATGKAGVIDSKGQFLRDLQAYWWVMLLFVVALAFFVVLVFVTRKR